ncbi:MAG: methionyl-tRNA formyltransferase [Patescibacteria group bacterium]
MKNILEKANWSFIGNSNIAIYFLDSLKKEYHIQPTRIFTSLPRPVGRKQILTPSPVYIYAISQGLEVIQSDTLDPYSHFFTQDDFVCVFAYGNKIRGELLDLPRTHFINIHPSLLPQYRGASPITKAILDDTKATGISIIEMSEEMDAGDIIGQLDWQIDEWQKYDKLEQEAASKAADLFTQVVPRYLAGKISPQAQQAPTATYTTKYTKSDMQIFSNMDEYDKYRHYCAFPKPFVMYEGKRYVVSEAHYTKEDGFRITKVTPEGKQTQAYTAFEYD